jgi:hypothetical protein
VVTWLVGVGLYQGVGVSQSKGKRLVRHGVGHALFLNIAHASDHVLFLWLSFFSTSPSACVQWQLESSQDPWCILISNLSDDSIDRSFGTPFLPLILPTIVSFV